ncbi:MAG: hypothetical protein KC621_07005 [Myxococcales bacterium]|nr:hypothetical protein [Myxococcales bacterium]
MIALLVGSAWAQQSCIQPMSRIQLGAALGDIDQAFREEDILDARIRLDQLGDRFPCYEEPMDPGLFARYARYVALAWFYKQDDEQSTRWGLSSRWADPDLPWDAVRFPREHPLRQRVTDAPMPPLGGGDEHFVVPRDGAVVVNGQLVAEPRVPADLPVLVQVFDGNRLLVVAFWQDGNVFPADFVAPGAEPLPRPSWWGEPSTPQRVVSRDRQPFPVVPVATGSALLVVSGVSYALAAGAAATMPDLRTSEELTSARTRANALVVVSAAALVGGLGIGVGGVLLSAEGVTIRF